MILTCPVTGLLIENTEIIKHNGLLDEFVYFGQGPVVKCVDSNQAVRTCITLNAFESVRIIRRHAKGWFLVAGKRLFSASADWSDAQCVDLGFADWILDLQIFDESAVLVTAHGRVMSLNVCSLTLTSNVLVEEYGLFYSAYILSPFDIYLGTIFNGIRLHSIVGDSLKCISKFESVHKGSIFDIQANEKFIFTCSDDRCVVVWNKVTGRWVQTLRGHDARVWRLACFQAYLVSASEDATVRVWKFVDNEYRLISILRGHFGKSVWSIAMKSVGEDIWVYSGGQDGSVRRWLLSDEDHCISENLRAFHKALDGTLFTLTNSTIYKNLQSAYYSSPYLQKYCIMTSDEEWLIIGDLTGRVHLLDRLSGNVTVFPCSSCKLVLICIIDKVIFIQDAKHTFYLLYISGDKNIDRMVSNDANIIISCISIKAKYIYVGTRDGHIYAFDCNLTEIYKRKLSDDAVTGIYFESGHLQFCTRGALYGITTIDLENLLSTERFFPMEGIRKYHGHLVVFGFHQKDFIIQNVADKQVISRIACGGGHRLWQFVNDEFFYLRESKLILVDLFKGDPVCQQALHGLETRVVCPCDSSRILAGGEDGYLLLLDYCLRLLYRIHLGASVKSIARFSQHQFIVAGAKELLCMVTIIGDCIRLSYRASSNRDLRIMSVAQDSDFIYTGASDGQVRVWKWTGNEMEFIRDFTSVHRCCTNLIAHETTLICAYSNGTLDFVHDHNISTVKAHSSTVTSMIMHDNILITGGDDGHIAIINVSNQCIRHAWHAHNATINGLIVQNNTLYSVSVDQIIKSWSMDEYVLVQAEYIPVTDPSCMCILAASSLLIAGRGMYIHNLPTDSLPLKMPRHV